MAPTHPTSEPGVAKSEPTLPLHEIVYRVFVACYQERHFTLAAIGANFLITLVAIGAAAVFFRYIGFAGEIPSSQEIANNLPKYSLGIAGVLGYCLLVTHLALWKTRGLLKLLARREHLPNVADGALIFFDAFAGALLSFAVFIFVIPAWPAVMAYISTDGLTLAQAAETFRDGFSVHSAWQILISPTNSGPVHPVAYVVATVLATTTWVFLYWVFGTAARYSFAKPLLDPISNTIRSLRKFPLGR